MKRKLIVIAAFAIAILITSFTNLWTQRQAAPAAQKQNPALSAEIQESAVELKPAVDVKFTKAKALANHFTGGLGGTTQRACETAYTFFIAVHLHLMLHKFIGIHH